MRELFIYYRVDPSRAVDARDAVRLVQQRLRTEVPGLQARLLTRSNDAGAASTWMETYAAPARPAGIDAALESVIARHAAVLAGVIEGPRHVEAFAPDLEP